jgi:hypothetical protein
MMPRFVFALMACATLVVAACGDGDPTAPDPYAPPAGLAACTSSPPLSQFPIPVGSITRIGPLGTMSGGGHLFPATHLGIHQVGDATIEVPLSAPGSLVLRQVARVTYSSPALSVEDYALFFFPCADLRMHFGHVSTLNATLLAELGEWTASDCAEPYVVNGTSIESCTKNVTIEVAAGAPLGMQLGTMDWGATDRRVRLAYVNPARFGGEDEEFGQNAAVCPVDYLTPAVRSTVHDFFGEAAVQRTAEPVCGTVMQDVAGTVQGRWFFNDDWNERLHLGLVRDYIDPAVAAFSVGTTIPSLPSNLYRFDPVDTGRVNVDFPHVGADGPIYCYEPTAVAPTSYLVFIQLLSETRLRIEGSPGTSCGAPESWAFSAGAVEFTR